MAGAQAVRCAGAAALALCALSACDNARETPPGPVPTSYSMETPDKPVPMPSPAPKEKCYGIAKAQANHGGAKGPGTARLDRQSDAWLFVPRGTCASLGGALTSRRDPRL